MKSMTITYEVDAGLYVNMTNRCSNNCAFCIRHNGDGAYGSDSLWLEHEPTLGEAEESILSRDLSRYSELVFCGYGEPSYRLADIALLLKKVRAAYPSLPVRINTNGQSDLIYGMDTAPFYDVFDTVSISLNASTASEYQKMCHSIYGEKSFASIINFAKNVKTYSRNTVFSVVDQCMSAEEIDICRSIAEEAGVKLRVRAYIPSDAK